MTDEQGARVEAELRQAASLIKRNAMGDEMANAEILLALECFSNTIGPVTVCGDHLKLLALLTMHYAHTMQNHSMVSTDEAEFQELSAAGALAAGYAMTMLPKGVATAIGLQLYTLPKRICTAPHHAELEHLILRGVDSKGGMVDEERPFTVLGGQAGGAGGRDNVPSRKPRKPRHRN